MALVPMMVVEYNNGRVPAGTREEAMRVATEAVNTFGGNREMAKAEADIVTHIKQTLNTKYGTTDWLCTANKSSVGAFCTHEGLNYSLLLRVGSFNILIWKENV